MNGDTNNVPMYKPVAFKPFIALEIPSLSKMAEISGNNIPCENPEIDTMITSIQKRFFSICVNVLMFAPLPIDKFFV